MSFEHRIMRMSTWLAAALAALHGLEPDEVARRTSQVAADLFRFTVE